MLLYKPLVLYLEVNPSAADTNPEQSTPAVPGERYNKASQFTLPANWMKRGNESEIFFDDENKQTVGGISVVGYYGDYGPSLPNHSKILSTEEVDSIFGKGKLFTLERSNPAASNNSKTWNEVHVMIPVNNNSMVYDIWVNVQKGTLINILKSCH